MATPAVFNFTTPLSDVFITGTNSAWNQHRMWPLVGTFAIFLFVGPAGLDMDTAN